MENAKLPDLSRLKDLKSRLKKLPPQESATDTSNWDNRDIKGPRPSIERNFLFSISPDVEAPTNPYLLQQLIKEKKQNKKAH